MVKTIITISGAPASGKTTAAKLLEESLRDRGFKRYYIGGILREMAAKEGATDFDAWYAQAKHRPSIDRDADEYTAKLAAERDDLIIDGRIAFHMARGSPYPRFNVFVTVAPGEAARRLLNADRKEGYGTLEQALSAWHARIADERERYGALYGIDHHDLSQYDHVVDSTGLSREQVRDEILSHLPRT